MRPAEYWRKNKNWKKWLGKKGIVIEASWITKSSPKFDKLAPYSFAVVDFEGEKKEFMGVSGEKLEMGDEIVCVFRKLSISKNEEIIPYGIKVQIC